MNKASKILTGIIGGTVLGILFTKLFSPRAKIAMRGKQLSNAIDAKWEKDKKDLEQTRLILEAELEDVKRKLEKLS